MFKEYYSHRFQEIFGASLQAKDGLGIEAVQSKLAERQLILPQALIDYYTLAGLHLINKEHNRLLSIEELNWIDKKLVFMQENQCVVCWGIDKADINQQNPVIWQGINGDVIEWYEESYKLSQFIMAMWKWLVSGEQEEPE